VGKKGGLEYREGRMKEVGKCQLVQNKVQSKLKLC